MNSPIKPKKLPSYVDERSVELHLTKVKESLKEFPEAELINESRRKLRTIFNATTVANNHQLPAYWYTNMPSELTYSFIDKEKVYPIPSHYGHELMYMFDSSLVESDAWVTSSREDFLNRVYNASSRGFLVVIKPQKVSGKDLENALTVADSSKSGLYHYLSSVLESLDSNRRNRKTAEIRQKELEKRAEKARIREQEKKVLKVKKFISNLESEGTFLSEEGIKAVYKSHGVPYPA